MIDEIYYTSGFTQWLWLVAKELYPIPEYVEEGEENTNGDFMPTFQKMSTKYGVEIYAQPFLSEALALLPFHANCEITFKNGLWGIMQDIEVEIDPIDFGCFAKVTITFTIQDNNVVKTSCG